MDTQGRWIGLAEVTPLEGSHVLDAGTGAFVAVVGDSATTDMFYNLAAREFRELRLKLIKLEDVELLSTRRRKHVLSQAFETAIAELCPANPLVFDSFHVFPINQRRKAGKKR